MFYVGQVKGHYNRRLLEELRDGFCPVEISGNKYCYNVKHAHTDLIDKKDVSFNIVDVDVELAMLLQHKGDSVFFINGKCVVGHLALFTHMMERGDCVVLDGEKVPLTETNCLFVEMGQGAVIYYYLTHKCEFLSDIMDSEGYEMDVMLDQRTVAQIDSRVKASIILKKRGEIEIKEIINREFSEVVVEDENKRDRPVVRTIEIVQRRVEDDPTLSTKEDGCES